MTRATRRIIGQTGPDTFGQTSPGRSVPAPGAMPFLPAGSLTTTRRPVPKISRRCTTLDVWWSAHHAERITARMSGAMKPTPLTLPLIGPPHTMKPRRTGLSSASRRSAKPKPN